MITTISLPIWILVGTIAVADICLLCWCLALMRRSRKADHSAAVQQQAITAVGQQWTAVHQFQQDLISLQIDAVFDGLSALIDAERIKLKSLLGQPAATNACVPSRTAADPDEFDDCAKEIPVEPVVDIAQQIAQIAASGKRPAGIANQLGISLAEVELAMKMQAIRRGSAAPKLEAVA